MKNTTRAVKAVKASKFHWFELADYNALICVSAEHGDGAANYYGEGGYPQINPDLEKIAAENKCYWEWLNTGAIALYEV